MLRAILTYHSIDDSGSVVSTSAAAFERQAASLAAQAVVVTRPEQIAARSTGVYRRLLLAAIILV